MSYYQNTYPSYTFTKPQSQEIVPMDLDQPDELASQTHQSPFGDSYSVAPFTSAASLAQQLRFDVAPVRRGCQQGKRLGKANKSKAFIIFRSKKADDSVAVKKKIFCNCYPTKLSRTSSRYWICRHSPVYLRCLNIGICFTATAVNCGTSECWSLIGQSTCQPIYLAARSTGTMFSDRNISSKSVGLSAKYLRIP